MVCTVLCTLVHLGISKVDKDLGIDLLLFGSIVHHLMKVWNRQPNKKLPALNNITNKV